MGFIETFLNGGYPRGFIPFGLLFGFIQNFWWAFIPFDCNPLPCEGI